MTSIEAHAVTSVVETRISVLLAQRQRDRLVAGPAYSPARIARDTELRALIRLVRSGRRLARQTVERTDPVTQGLAYHDWQAAGPVTEAELIAGYAGTGR